MLGARHPYPPGPFVPHHHTHFPPHMFAALDRPMNTSPRIANGKKIIIFPLKYKNNKMDNTSKFQINFNFNPLFLLQNQLRCLLVQYPSTATLTVQHPQKVPRPKWVFSRQPPVKSPHQKTTSASRRRRRLRHRLRERFHHQCRLRFKITTSLTTPSPRVSS